MKKILLCVLLVTLSGCCSVLGKKTYESDDEDHTEAVTPEKNGKAE